MKLKSIVAAIALSTAFSATAAVCDEHPRTSVMNATELSEFQKCWLTEHRSGPRAFGRDWDNHGVHANLFWIRVGGKYYSTPLKDLRTKLDRERFVAQIEAAELAEHQAVVDYVNNSLELNKIESDIDAIEEQIALAKEIVSLQKALELVGGENKALQAKIDEIKTKLEPFLTDAQELLPVTEQVQTAIDLHKNLITHLETELNGVKDAKKEVEADLADAEKDLAEANATIAVRDGTITELETKVSGLESDLATAKEDLAEANATIAVRDGTITELETKVSGLESDLATAKEDLAEANATIAVRDGTITELETKVSGLESELATAKEDLDEANATIAVRDGTITELETKVSGLESELATAKEDLNEANATIALRDGTITELETKVSGLESELATANKTIATHVKTIADLNQDITDLEDTLAAVNNTDYESEQDAIDQTVDKTGQQIADYLNGKDKVTATWDAEAETNKLTVDLSAFWDDYDAVKEKLKPFLSDEQELLSMVEQVQAAIDAHNNLITHLETELDGVKAAKKEVEKDLADANIEIGNLEAALGDYASANEAYKLGEDAGKALVENEFVGTLEVDATGVIYSDDYEGLADAVHDYVTDNFSELKALKDARDAALETLEDELENLSISVSGYTDPTVQTNGHKYTLNGKTYLGSISVNNVTYNFGGDPANSSENNINLGEMSYISDIKKAEIDLILKIAETAYKQGYEDGYDDGYKAGYADGYADGFTDGVNSVK